MSDDPLTRVLLVAPTKKDGEVTSSLLHKAGLSCIVCEDLNHLAREVRAGAGAVLLTEEVLGAGDRRFAPLIGRAAFLVGPADHHADARGRHVAGSR